VFDTTIQIGFSFLWAVGTRGWGHRVDFELSFQSKGVMRRCIENFVRFFDLIAVRSWIFRRFVILSSSRNGTGWSCIFS
jgi:hypothetical protein